MDRKTRNTALFRLSFILIFISAILLGTTPKSDDWLSLVFLIVGVIVPFFALRK